MGKRIVQDRVIAIDTAHGLRFLREYSDGVASWCEKWEDARYFNQSSARAMVTTLKRVHGTEGRIMRTGDL